ncbi:hypothetical protein AB0C84_35870 [Actinomadura sp. NPDC048955]|uniref:hypothetical protein n=1 Tax=Actinomadura sp. NPDC048955 TaxID=3158228 RepID=UPI0033C4913C
MPRSSGAHQQKIARALQQQLGGAVSYQEALRRVRAAAAEGSLPRTLDKAGRAEAVRLLAAGHLPAAAPGAVINAGRLHTALGEFFRAAGWPVESETRPALGRYLSYPGPITMFIGRGPADTVGASGVGVGTDDPDDPAVFDLAQPPYIQVAAPLGPERGDRQVEKALLGTANPGQVMGAARDMLATGRSRILKAAHNDTRCAICRDAYPIDHLVVPDVPGRRVCPACVFDEDTPWQGPVPVLALQLDRLWDRDLAAPAGWSAVTALLACVGGPRLREVIERAWFTDDILYSPMDAWSVPDDIWIWLPERPICAALAPFGPGARLGAVVQALDCAYPALRDRVRAELAEIDAEIAAEGGEGDQPRPDRFVQAVWPALVAYVISMSTQAAERPDQRPPLQHLSGSFEMLPHYMREIGSDLNPDDVVSTLECGLELLPRLLRASVLDTHLIGKTVSTMPLPASASRVVIFDGDPQTMGSGQDRARPDHPDDFQPIILDVPWASEPILPRTPEG